ncbi:MAG TPA: type II toxin-antitoxin system prevent-host-death family antitoxin [Acidimicrobiales bacterium]
MDVGIRELKAKLSTYLKRAASGEVLTITDHGRPVAVLAPVAAGVGLAQGAEEGWITLPTRSGLTPVERQRAAIPTERALGEDRGA